MTPATGLLIFDGDCGFCTSSAEWVSRSWPPGPETAAWQHLGDKRLAELGLTTREAQDAAWWVDGAGRKFRGHRAMAKSLLAARGWKRAAGALIDVPPGSWVAAAAYPLITRYRYHLPGGTPACRATRT
jgi:predicted DCC family thiol-disulfide oxidoreductase YuxK